MKFFELNNARVWRGDVVALDSISLDLSLRENVAILGANGAGKSTLLKLMTGEVRPQAGPKMDCRVFGEDRWSLDDLRQRIGLVMPEEVSRFHPEEIAADVVRSVFRGAYGRTGDMRFSSIEKEKAGKAMEDLGVLDLEERFFGQLSSGERRRFLIARALAHEPEILILDEPSTALDFSARLSLLGKLQELAKTPKTLVLVTHDPTEILPEIERVILLQRGRVIADGPKKKVLSSETMSELYGMNLQLRWAKGWPLVRPKT